MGLPAAARTGAGTLVPYDVPKIKAWLQGDGAEPGVVENSNSKRTQTRGEPEERENSERLRRRNSHASPPPPTLTANSPGQKLPAKNSATVQLAVPCVSGSGVAVWTTHKLVGNTIEFGIMRGVPRGRRGPAARAAGAARSRGGGAPRKTPERIGASPRGAAASGCADAFAEPIIGGARRASAGGAGPAPSSAAGRLVRASRDPGNRLCSTTATSSVIRGAPAGGGVPGLEGLAPRPVPPPPAGAPRMPSSGAARGRSGARGRRRRRRRALARDGGVVGLFGPDRAVEAGIRGSAAAGSRF